MSSNPLGEKYQWWKVTSTPCTIKPILVIWKMDWDYKYLRKWEIRRDSKTYGIVVRVVRTISLLRDGLHKGMSSSQSCPQFTDPTPSNSYQFIIPLAFITLSLMYRSAANTNAPSSLSFFTKSLSIWPLCNCLTSLDLCRLWASFPWIPSSLLCYEEW